MYWFKKFGLRFRILIPASLLISAILIVLLLLYRAEEIDHFREDGLRRFNITENSYHAILVDQSSLLSVLLDNVLAKPDIVKALQQQNRELLYQLTQDIYSHINRYHDVTHFYFFGPDRKVILRVHKPEKYGDVINRKTLLQAEALHSNFNGPELGPLGTFTLRSVTPCFQNGRLIGYVEMGMEVEPLIEKVNNITSTLIVVLINKKYLNQNDWGSGMKMLGRYANWDELNNEVITYASQKEITNVKLSTFYNETLDYPDISIIDIFGKYYISTFQVLADSEGVVVGRMLLIHDITSRMVGNKKLQMTITLTIAGVGSLVLVFFYSFLGHIERDLFESENALKESSREREIQQAKHIHALENEHNALLLAQQELEASEHRLEEAQRIAHVGNWEWDIRSGKLYLSAEIIRIFGGAPDSYQPSYEAFLEIVHPDDLEAVKHAINQALYEKESYRLDHRIKLASGLVRHVHARGEVIYSERNEPVRMVGIMQDVSERKQTIEQINYLAYYDRLTGLPNRTLLLDRLSQVLIESRRNNHIAAVIALDMDQLKSVNETLGYEAGDALLNTIATRLKSTIREGDTLARMGGDEFVIVLSDINLAEDVVLVADKILSSFYTPVHLEGRELFITSSLGITLFPNDGDECEELLRNADSALFHAKSMGRNNYQFYTSDMTVRAQERFKLELGLRRALENNEFRLVYQPQISLATGKVNGVEVLLRWQHSTEGMIAPSKFIPLAEDTGMIVPIGEWVLRTALTQLKLWNDAGIDKIKMAVNLSSSQFRHNDLLQTVSHSLDQAGVAPEFLDLEITESMLMEDSEYIASKLNGLKALGVTISLDDFGTGYSSLSYLKRFPIDILKIDQSFTRDVLKGPDDASLVRAIIAMARSLNLRVIAEGVETYAQLSFMRNEGCHEVQGFYCARPMFAEDVLTFMRKNLEEQST